MPAPTPTSQHAALDAARALINAGCAVFAARPALNADGTWNPRGGTGGCGYWLPKGWQNTPVDTTTLDEWRPGYALGAVMSGSVDALDIDPRHGGDDTIDTYELLEGLPETYGEATTPSGGRHLLIPSLGLGSGTNVIGPGVDLRGSREDGTKGLGYIFISPTRKLSKTTGDVDTYQWVTAPHPTDAHESPESRALAEAITRHTGRGSKPAAAAPAAAPAEPYDSLTPAQQAMAREAVDAVRDHWREKAIDMADWPEGQVDDHGRGWEKNTADAAYALATLALAPWTPYTLEEAEADLRDWYAPMLAEVGDKWASQSDYAGNNPSTWPRSPWVRILDGLDAFDAFEDDDAEDLLNDDAEADGETITVDGPDGEPVTLSVDAPWIASLDRDDKGAIRKSDRNLAYIVAHDKNLSQLGMSALGGKRQWRQLPSWRRRGTDTWARTSSEFTDADEAWCRAQVRAYFGGSVAAVTDQAVDQAVARYVSGKVFNPVADYLDALPAWDGVPRVDRAISTVPDDEDGYSRTVMRNFFLSAVQRTYDPGCQVDTMPVLVGAQGTRKTSWCRAIAPQGLYFELATVPDGDRGKDQLTGCHESALVIADELDKLLRRLDDQSGMKAFLSGRKDTWRAPYARNAQTMPRRFVFIGTTNESEFLPDLTGNRRYQPLQVVAPIPPEDMTPDRRAHLWAEARDRYRAGERPDYSEHFEHIAAEHVAANVSNPVGEAIEAWIAEQEESDMGMPTDRLSVYYVIENVPELQGMNPAKGARDGRVIAQALDALPGYYRNGGRNTRVAGRIVRRAWIKE